MIRIWPCSWFHVFCSVLVKQVPEEIFSIEKIVVTLSLDCLSVVMFSDCLTRDRGWDPFSAGACAAHDGDNTRERRPSQLRPGSRVRGGCPTNPRSEGRSSPPAGGAPPGWSIRRDQRLARLLGEALLHDSTALVGVSAGSLPSSGLPVPRNEAESASWTKFPLQISHVRWASWWVGITTTCGWFLWRGAWVRRECSEAQIERALRKSCVYTAH